MSKTAEAAKRAVLAGMLALGGGCVAFSVGDPVSVTHEQRTLHDSSATELAGLEPSVVQEQGYSHASVGLRANVKTTTRVGESVTVERTTVTRRKRVAVGVFPGAAMYFQKSRGPNGMKPIGPCYSWTQYYWRGLRPDEYIASIILPFCQPYATPYTLFVAPFTEWTVRGGFHCNSWEFVNGHHVDLPPGTPYAKELRAFSPAEFAECAMEPGDFTVWRWSDALQAGLVGTVKYPDIFVQREREEFRQPPEATTTNFQWRALPGPFEAELRIPEVGYHARGTTGTNQWGGHDDTVDFALPTHPGAGEMVTVTNRDGQAIRERRTYFAQVTFRPIQPKEADRQAWAKAAGRTFETRVRLDAGYGQGPTQVVVTEVHHWYETKAEASREFEVEKSGDGSWRVRILSGSLNALDADAKVKPRILESLREEFAERNPDVPRGEIRAWAAYTTEDGGRTLVYEGAATTLIPALESLSYHAETRCGVVTMRLADRANLAKSKQFVRENIGAIVCDKNVALTAGERPPDGAAYRSLDENYADGVLTVEFEAVE